ncbi:MAG TPA: O-antigen ligase family protein [Acidobacteriaceae bacterium]|nr:O-antigen ligase family protein [Acidobacteriaceae bacterium]
MGFALSILYFLICYLTPQMLFGALAVYRIALILICVILLLSIPSMQGSIIWKTVQSFALGGFLFAIFASGVFGEHWISGGLTAIQEVAPNVLVYFLICLHCNSKKKLQIVILALLSICLFVIVEGAIELHTGTSLLSSGNVDSNTPYVFKMGVGEGQFLYRVRGEGQIADPNDFAQLMVCVLPLLFFFWKPKRKFRNFICVLLPSGVLLWGLFLTHSRGGMLALIGVVLVASRKRIGTVPALIVAGAVFAGASALHFAGQRDISLAAGADRTEFWGDSLELLKTHPLFGVGFEQTPDYFGHTAHNTIAVCAAELGLTGLFFWSMFVFLTVRDTLAVAGLAETSEVAPPMKYERAYVYVAGVEEGNVMERMVKAKAEERTISWENGEGTREDRMDTIRMGRLLLTSLVGFMVAGWFLSRAYTITLFLLGGFASVIFHIAQKQGMDLRRIRLGRALRDASITTAALIVLMYIVLRFVNLSR